MNEFIVFSGKSRHFEGRKELQPAWWLEYTPIQNIYKNKYRKECLQRILQSYQLYISKGERLSLPTLEASTPSPFGNEDQMDTPSQMYEDEVVPSPTQDDLDTSSEPFFPNIKEPNDWQPDLTYDKSELTLAELTGVKPISPIPLTVSTIISETVRSSCLAELSNPNTFLSDVTINAFCVSY